MKQKLTKLNHSYAIRLIASVQIYNTTSSDILGSAKVEDKNSWTVTIKNPAVVPCMVRVDITKETQQGSKVKSVDRAPKTCK